MSDSRASNLADSASGVRVERRSLVWLPVALAGGSLAFGEPQASASPGLALAGDFEPLDRETFAARWRALAGALKLGPVEHDEIYASQLCALIARLPLEELPRLDKPKGPNGIAGGPAWFLLPCLTVEFRMDPGATLRLHNHPPQVVVTLGLEGEVAYRHLEVEGSAPPCTTIDGKRFLVRESRAGMLTRGRTTSLTRARDGMHGFVAGRPGGRILDFTFSLTDDVETFSYVEVAPEPRDAERRVFEAHWLGKSV